MNTQTKISEVEEIKSLFNTHFRATLNAFNCVDFYSEIVEEFDFLFEVANAILCERFHVVLSCYEERHSKKRVYAVVFSTYEKQVHDETQANTVKNIECAILCETANSALTLMSLLISTSIDI